MTDTRKLIDRIHTLDAQIEVLQQMRDELMDRVATVAEYDLVKMVSAKINKLFDERDDVMKQWTDAIA